MNYRLGAILAPFTYLRDTAGYIYYARHPVFSEEEDGYSCVGVYHPDPMGERSQATTGLRYGKVAFQGLGFEVPHLLKSTPKHVSDYLLARSRRGGIFNREFMFVPNSEIMEVYSPKASLEHLLMGHATRLHQRSLSSVRAAVAAFESVGIPLEHLGLYGSLQCGVIRDDPTRQLKDIDMLVTGVGYYGSIRRLAQKYPASAIPLPETVAISPTRSAAVLRRRTIAQFKIPGQDGLHCDVRIVRGPDCPNTYHERVAGEPEQIALARARVVAAGQSLSLPFAYRIEHQRRYLWVVGTHYRFIGAAGVGDTVDVRGLKIDEDVVLISHPTDDWINHANT